MHFHPPENRKKMRISGSSAVLVALLALATVVVGQFYVRPLPRLQLQVHCLLTLAGRLGPLLQEARRRQFATG
jgi:hypothetical protein